MSKRDQSEGTTYPRSINHVGVGVADIERAIHWYQEVLGFTLLMGPTEVRATPGYRANEVRDVLGQNFNAMLQAHMVSVNGIGIELFQLLDPPHERGSPPWSTGRVGSFTFASPTPISRSSRSASPRPAAVKGLRSGELTREQRITGFVTARTPLGTSSRFIPITTRRCTAV